MPTLLLKFAINLEDYSLSSVDRHHGPLFHRWLPDGEQDSMILDAGNPDAELKVWFERRGFVEHGFIVFDYERREVDPELVPKQAVLDAGPLMGLLRIQGLPDRELAPLRENKVGDAGYLALGRRVVKKILYPPLSRFVDLLRTNCGQYWVPALEEWDSRKGSLGYYCGQLQLRWSLDGQDWERFRPDRAEVRVTGTVQRRFPGYLTREDWLELGKVVREGHEPSLAASFLARAHRLSDQENTRYAFIEGVSALELALGEFVRPKLGPGRSLLDSVSAFWNLPLHAQVVAVGAVSGKVPPEDMQGTVKAVGMRNRIIHEGWSPPENARVELSALLRTVAALLSGPAFRFPSAHALNRIASLEDWEQQAQEDPHGD